MSSITGFTLIALFIISSFSVIASIGKERKPVTAGFAAVVVAIDLTLIALVLWDIITGGK